MTKNKLNFDTTRKQIEAFLPEEMKGPILKAMDICEKQVAVASDKCETAYKWVDQKYIKIIAMILEIFHFSN